MTAKVRRRFRSDIVKAMKFNLGTLTARQLKRLKIFMDYLGTDVACDGCWDKEVSCESCSTYIERHKNK